MKHSFGWRAGLACAVLASCASVSLAQKGTSQLERDLIDAQLKEPGSIHARRAETNSVYAQTRGFTPRVIYGDDNRIEVWEEPDATLRAISEAACVVVFTNELSDNGNGTYTLDTSPWTSQSGLSVCTDEPFRGQPQIGFCSGFLVGEDIITTAGHCVDSGDIGGVAFVFNFEIDTMGGSAPTVVPASDVYFLTEVINRAQAGDLDHSVCRVDRAVTGRAPVDIRRTGSIANGDPIAVIGHPTVLPKKISGGAECKNANGAVAWFQANLDTYGGNSGSMVVNLNTYQVEGILVRGAPDYRTRSGQNCTESNRVPDTGNTGGGLTFEEVSKSTGWASFVPPLGLVVNPADSAEHVGLVGGPFSNPSAVYTTSNNTGATIPYEVTISGAGGLLLDGGSGPLSGNVGTGSSFNTTVTLDPAVNGWAAGVYETDVVFTDLNTDREVRRTHTIEIGQTRIAVSPANDVLASGPVGGPLSGQETYTITSERPTSVDVRVSASQPWVLLDGGTAAVNFTLPSDGSFQDVAVDFDAGLLGAGIANATITFENLTAGTSETREVMADIGRFVYPSLDTPRAINDNTSFDSVINVPDSFCVGDVEVDVDLTHSFSGDLIIELIAPDGTTVRLHDRTGSSDDYTPRRYDDDGGGVLPDGPGELADFEGVFSVGAWTLRVSDNANLDTGTLNAWSLRIASQGSICPPTAGDIELGIPANEVSTIALDGASSSGVPDFIITSLPTMGVLWQGNGQPILAVPFTLSGDSVLYHPFSDYVGADSFAYETFDGLTSPTATVSLDVGGDQLVYFFPFDSNPGWATEGMWEFGVPQGVVINGRSDPSSGYTGTNVYGYNLAGDYTNSMPVYNLTSTPIDCSDLTNTTVRFKRWLGVESSTFDHASFRAGTGGSFTIVWDHSGASFAESAWSTQTYDISAIADGNPDLQLRWTMGTTDTSVTYPGWNIDDVEIIGTIPPRALGDYDRDTFRTSSDFLSFLNDYSMQYPGADFTGDGMFNSSDFLSFLNYYVN
ncbi:MAG: proprotein convertase P-domain-containing protein [Phycisphaerales bacterium]|nr:proprotein convertase P-domain-containing protein [Phycisphaerales bacterium]